MAAACGGGSTGRPGGKHLLDRPADVGLRVTAQSEKRIGTAPADRIVHQLSGFVSPLGNVSCMIDAAWARCDIIDRDWSPPARPADHEFDYGQGISLASGEHAQFVCAGDTAFGADEVLPYGGSIAGGAPRCESAESGMTWRDLGTATGSRFHGRRISCSDLAGSGDH
jgi:hypothetical protein